VRGLASGVLLVSLLMANAGGLPASQEIVDRIAARVENDIILLSDIRMLSRYQEFLDGKSETDAQILDRLIDQWMVRTEADVARFPHPSEAEIDRSLESLRKSFTSAEQYEARKKQSGLSDSEVRGIAFALPCKSIPKQLKVFMKMQSCRRPKRAGRSRRRWMPRAMLSRRLWCRVESMTRLRSG